MVIHVNRQFLNFNLENEKNLKDILQSLEEWVAENGEVIQRVLVDDIHIPLETETKELQRTVSSIEKIEVFTAKKEQHAIETVATLTEYMSIIMGDYLRAEGTETYEDTIEGLQLVYEGIVEVVKVFGINDVFVIDKEKRSLRSVLGEMRTLYEKYEKKYIDKKGKEDFESVLKKLFFLCPKLIKWGVVKNMKKFPMVQTDKKSEYFKELASDFYTIIYEKVDIFEKISENLQLGNDTEALGEIYHITEILDEYIVLFKIAKESFGIKLDGLKTRNTKLEDLFADIHSRLEDVSEALKQGDMISVGDTLEYETKPLFEELIEFLRELIELLGQIKDFTFFY
jgi:hypothetical protein